MKIDFHVHFNTTDPELIKQFAKTCAENETIAVLSGGLRYGAHDYTPNEKVLTICKQYPEVFIPMAKFDLWDQVDPGLVRRYADAGFRGLKFIYPYYEYDHDLYMPIYEEAEKCGLPLLFHTGNFRPNAADVIWKRPVLKNMDPLNLDRIARSFQNLHLVMAHLGTTIWRTQAAEYIKMHSNLYADLAGNGSWQALSAEKMVELLSPSMPLADRECRYFQKLIYGSDAYVTHPQIMCNAQRHYEAMLEKVGVPPEVHDAIMGGTVAKWLEID